ncbi:MAG TPA: type II toxin-antitoxin system VapC family toxin [Blastocatellia bacterium]|nr:type II toxin-antitoxin system VapC family toxin [Blastocatellia bacterium]
MIGNAIVDTDVASFIFKRDTRAALYEPHLRHRISALSFQTVAEMEQWSAVRSWGNRRIRELEEFFTTFVIVESDPALCKIWGRIRAQAVQQGRPIETADAWIAATALRYRAPLVTHNRSHFQQVADLIVISMA